MVFSLPGLSQSYNIPFALVCFFLYVVSIPGLKVPMEASVIKGSLFSFSPCILWSGCHGVN